MYLFASLFLSSCEDALRGPSEIILFGMKTRWSPNLPEFLGACLHAPGKWASPVMCRDTFCWGGGVLTNWPTIVTTFLLRKRSQKILWPTCGSLANFWPPLFQIWKYWGLDAPTSSPSAQLWASPRDLVTLRLIGKSTHLLRKLRKFSTGFWDFRKFFLVSIYLKLDLSVYKMSCMWF